MISQSLLVGLTTECRHSYQEDWSPPASLLEAVSDDDELIADLIDTFLTDSDTRLGKMREALAALNYPPNYQKIRFEAHTIKSAARTVGADAVADACQELEIMSDLLAPLVIAGRLNRVQELLENIRGAMAAYSNSKKMAVFGDALVLR